LKKKKIIWTVIILGVLLAALYAYKEYTRTHADLSKTRADIQLPSAQLMTAYQQNDSLANMKYLGKIIETSGRLKEIEFGDGYYTLIIGDEKSLSTIRCLMDSTYNDMVMMVRAGSQITVRGECTGFKRNEILGENLGSDVELNRSVLVLPKTK
jgi:hypothetical protein